MTSARRPPGPDDHSERRAKQAERREQRREEAKRRRDEVTRIRSAALAVGILGTSKPLLGALAEAGRASSGDGPVLVLGETGTGKELVAWLIHKLGRARGPFVAVNCGSVPNNLVAAELFGQAAGAFTDGLPKIGRFEEADKGTLFLDEIGELPLEAQAALLRVLEERRVHPVGERVQKAQRGPSGIPVDVKIVAATNRDPLREISGGRFRQDLYYRLSRSIVQLPPLRERGSDLVSLARHFAAKANRKLSGDARRSLAGYVWPGNVRELDNVIDAASKLTRSTIEAKHLRTIPAPGRTSTTLDRRLAEAGAVIDAVEALGVASKSEIGKRVKRPTRTIERELGNLVSADVLVVEGSGRSLRYRLHPSMAGSVLDVARALRQWPSGARPGRGSRKRVAAI